MLGVAYRRGRESMGVELIIIGLSLILLLPSLSSSSSSSSPLTPPKNTSPPLPSHSPIPNFPHRPRRLIHTTADEAKIAQMETAISSLQAKIDKGISELDDDPTNIASNSSPGKTLINKLAQHPVNARPMSARRRSTPNLALDIIPEERKKLLAGYR